MSHYRVEFSNYDVPSRVEYFSDLSDAANWRAWMEFRNNDHGLVFRSITISYELTPAEEAEFNTHSQRHRQRLAELVVREQELSQQIKAEDSKKKIAILEKEKSRLFRDYDDETYCEE